MKNLTYLLLLLPAVFAACSGSDTYRGHWKATDMQGKKYEIDFASKSFTVKDSAGGTQTHDYKQHSVSVQNSIKTYGITLGDGRQYLIHFPVPGDESTAIIQTAEGLPLYFVDRNKYTNLGEMYKLN